MSDFQKWLETWRFKGASRYTFPDGVTVDFEDLKKLEKYFNKYIGDSE